MNRIRPASCFLALALLTNALLACNKAPNPSEVTPPAASAASPAPTGGSASAAAAPNEPPLTGLDPCLVGSWKSKTFSLSAAQATAEGGANVTMNIVATGDTVVDFGPMAPINAKGAGVSFDFQYSGKASATLSTPTRGALTSSKADYAGLRVTASVQIPGATKMDLFKNKPVSELAQMATAVAGAKAPAGAPPPGLDSTPIFSTSRYACADGMLTLDSSDQLAAKWTFARAGN
jgi:hypothetical protein